MHFTWIGPLIISIVSVFICILVNHREETSEQVGSAIFTAVASVMLGFLFCSLVCLITSKYHWTPTAAEETKAIYSAELAQRAHGSIGGAFTIFSGHYSNDDYYFVYVDYGNGAMKLERFDIDVTYVREADEKPHLDKCYKRLVNDRPFFSVHDDGVRQFEYNVLTVPRGTVIQRYDVNISK